MTSSKSAGLRALQVTAALLAVATVGVAALHEWAFTSPGAGFRDFLSQTPQVAGLLTLPLFLFAFWLWLTRGKADPKSALREFLVERIAGSARLLAISIVFLAAVFVVLGYRVLASETVRLSMQAAEGEVWNLYLDCRPADRLEDCGTPVELGPDPRVLRLAVPTAAVLTSDARRQSVVIEGSKDFFPPPPADARKSGDLVLIYPFIAKGNFSATTIAQRVARALRPVAERDPDVYIVVVAEPHSDALAEDWAEQGVRPSLALFGRYDDVQARGTLRARLGDELELHFTRQEPVEAPSQARSGEFSTAASSSPVSLLRALVPLDLEEPFVVDFEQSFDARATNERFPDLAAAYLSYLLGMVRLTEHRDELARLWLAQSARLAPWREDEALQGDAAFRSLLQAMASFRMDDAENGVAHLSRAVGALQGQPPDSRDLIAHGPLRERLPRMAMSLFMVHVMGEFFEAADAMVRRIDRRDTSTIPAHVDDAADAWELVAKRAGGPNWRRLLGFAFDHLEDFFHLSGIAGSGRRDREQLDLADELARKAEAATDPDRAELLALEAEYRRAQAYASAFGPLAAEVHLQAIESERRWLEARLRQSAGAADDLRTRLDFLAKKQTKFQQAAELWDIYQESLSDAPLRLEENRSLRCGPELSFGGRFSVPDSVHLTLPGPVIWQLARLYAKCDTCGFPDEFRLQIATIPKQLGCPRR